MAYTLFEDTRTYADLPNTMRDKVDKYKVEDSYKTIPYIYAANNVIGNSISSVPLKFYTADGAYEAEKMRNFMQYKHKTTIKNIKALQYNKKQIIQDSDSLKEIDQNHEIYKIFNPPSDNYNSMSEFNFMTWVLMGLFGEAFWVFEFGENNKASKPTGVNIQSPYYVREYIDENTGKLTGWIVEETTQYGYKQGAYARERVIQYRYPNPYNSFRGLSPLLPGRLTSEEYTNMKIANASYFANGFKSNIALETDLQFQDPRKREEYTRVFNSLYNDFTKRNMALILGRGEQVKKLFDGNDLDYIEGFNLNLGEIAAIYQVPKLFLQETGSTNYNTSSAESKSLWENCILPKLALQQQSIQNQLLNKYFPNVFVDWDYDNIDALRDDPIEIIKYKLDESNVVLNYMAAGYTRAEIANLLENDKLNPDETKSNDIVEVANNEDVVDTTTEEINNAENDMKIFARRKANIPILETDFNDIKIEYSKENGKRLVKLKVTSDFLTDYQRKYERYVLTPLENQYKKYMDSYLNTAINSLVRQVSKNSTYPHLNPSDWDNMWLDLSYNLVEQTYKTGAAKTQAELKNPKKILRSLIIKQTNPIEEIYGSDNWEIMLQSINEINQKTVGFSQRAISELNSMMSTYISQGLSVLQIRKNLDENKEMIFASNATTVSRTVTGVAYNTARHQSMYLGGVKSRRWASSLDMHTRQDHLRQHTSLQEVVWGQVYRYTQLLYPQDSNGKADQIINCRCTETAGSYYDNPNIHNTLITL